MVERHLAKVNVASSNLVFRFQNLVTSVTRFFVSEVIYMDYMKAALTEAKKAFDNGEIPIGAVITLDGKIIASGKNTCQNNKDCTCHAEINAIRQACQYTKSKTLDNCEMYVTVEPCAMCTGAIINARIRRLYIGTEEPKTGCCGSKTDLTKKGLFNHDVEVYFGFSEEESKSLMQSFFKDKREK